MTPRRVVVTLAVLLALGHLPGASWAPDTRVRIADEAVRLMPASLRMALERHRDELLRGLLEPQLDEEAAQHRPSWSGGALEAEIESRARSLVESVEGAAPFHEIARNFGALAHFVMDAGFPPGVSKEGGSRYTHFAQLCRERQDRFRLVFYGHESTLLDDQDYRGYARTVVERALSDDAELARAYRLAAETGDPSHFDDRSIPFAIAALSLSRTVTDVTRVWLTAWRQSYGDTGRTPYLGR